MENGAGSSMAIETTSSKALFSDNNAVIGSVDMANYPEIELTVTKTKENDAKKLEKVNGEARTSPIRPENEDSLSDREGALVIDESPIEIKHKKRKRMPVSEFKGFKKRILAQTSERKNLYPKKPLFDYESKPALTITKIPKAISEKSNLKNEIEITREPNVLNKIGTGEKRADDVDIIRESRPAEQKETKRVSKGNLRPKKTEKVASNQKREYAQYLGLQPALKFKCIRCGVSNFPSLADLNDHRRQCSAVGSSPVPTTPSPNSTNFKITRKVFLCSACGTYYEVWNLFLHMREVHHRHICLICLGLFSAAEKLSSHLSMKHDAPPKMYDTVADFRKEYDGQLFVMCVTCEKMFTESDDFSKHTCEMNSVNVENIGSAVKNQDNSSMGSHSISKDGHSKDDKNLSKSSKSQKGTLGKSTGKVIKNKILPSEHVTADTSFIENVEEKNESSDKRIENDNREYIDNEKLKEESSTVKIEDSEMTAAADEKNESSTIKPEEDEITDVNSKVLEEEVERSENGCKNKIAENESLDPVAKSTEPENNIDTKVEKGDADITNKEIESDSEKISNSSDKINTQVNDVIESPLENKQISDVMAFQNKINESDIFDKKTDDSSNEIVQLECDKLDQSDVAEEDRNNIDVEVDVSKNFEEDCAHASPDALECDAINKASDTEDSNRDVDEKYSENLRAVVETDQDQSDESTKTESESDEIVSEPRVPKVTLKIPPRIKMSEENYDSGSESDDSLKLTMEIDEKDITENVDVSEEKCPDPEHKPDNKNDSFPTAGSDVAVIELGVRPSLDKVSIQSLLKDFIRVTCNTCAYCNHARKIAVNGKQLGLHVIAEHRFSAIADSITAEELLPETFVRHIEEHFDELKVKYFNLESYDDTEPDQMIPYDRTYECFRCRFVTTVHKELYLHNRKMHQKTILLCIMCKSTFYSYSELLCHMCPGNYTGAEVTFRCCLCLVDRIPSAFRLMVHLRKRHHACDVCLDACGDQTRLSNHVWKHKLHHLCYRCGIAYRNKPDITRHLFWKHGTESVLCKRCLSKKWPHVYHFCTPPLSFSCEDCGSSFLKAVALIVHRRSHTDIKPHSCSEDNCSERFISKRLLEKHITAHREPICVDQPTLESEANAPEETEPVDVVNEDNHSSEVVPEEEIEIKPKPVVDVYDLPALNLSESDSDSDDEANPIKPDVKPEVDEPESNIDTFIEPEKPAPIVDGIWDDFKNYQASVEKREFDELDTSRTPLDRLAEAASLEALKAETTEGEPVYEKDGSILGSAEIVSCDHAYCAQIKPLDEEKKEEPSGDVDHDYCNSDKEQKEKKIETPKKSKSPKKKSGGSSSSSSSSSDSDSSTCSCTSNCSCMRSSASGSSSSSSSNSDSGSSGSEAKRRAATKKQRRKERAKNKNKSSDTIDVTATDEPEKIIVLPVPTEIHESDLYTTESETDEDFYDEYPHRFAKKLIEEKKNRLIMEVAGSESPALNGNFLEMSRSSTPNVVETPPIEVRKKSKVKSKKRKKNPKNVMRRRSENLTSPPVQETAAYYTTSVPIVPISRPPIDVIVSRPSPGTPTTPFGTGTTGSGSETDGNLRSSKRRRVPNKFYGYSSDDDSTAVKPPEPPQLEWNKEDLPSPPRIAPAPILVPEPTFVGPTWKRPIPDKRSSSDSETEADDHRVERPPYPVPVAPIPQLADRQGLQQRPNENLYCYCQCPYDEVSEMIACDAKNCKIEWFHFECVGIMVPPKGKWYCPDCRNKQTSTSHPRPNEYFMS